MDLDLAEAHMTQFLIHISLTNRSEKYVLDADISKCFDYINHDYLLSKIDCPNFRPIIKQWLKAGVMDNSVFEETHSGTPQGGVISPLLANIALHGMIDTITKQFPNSRRIGNGKKIGGLRPNIIRYADDFVVLAQELPIILKAKTLIEEWLKPVGLELKPEKTSIRHTLKEIEIDGEKVLPGFDFLGFNIRSYPVGKHRSTKIKCRGVIHLKGFITLIKPSKKSIKKHREVMKKTIKELKTAPQEALIKKLNPIIKGWCNYFRSVVSKEVFSDEDNQVWLWLRAWTASRTGRSNYKNLRKYFSHGKLGAWTFQKNEYRLLKHQETKIIRHILVKAEASPYDGNWIYWSQRRGNYPETPIKVAKLIKKQKGICALCNLHFTSDDLVEVDHIIPRSKGGKDEYKNFQLLHRHCHHVKTRTDGSNDWKDDDINCTYDKG
jgi:RNA-directed DNA polymerase